MDLTWLCKNKEILIGVSGGIAAYKVPELVRAFSKSGAVVRVISTKAGLEFFAPLAVEALCRKPVLSEVLDVTIGGEIPHISFAERSDLFLVAPATANVLAKLAVGVADDLLTSTALAYRGPMVVAPGMNKHMWAHPATQKNVEMLKERGVVFVGPEIGELACGYSGIGRMSSPATLFEACASFLVNEKPLKGKSVLVTAGSTREPWDPVRFLGNRSTGRMGYAVARAAVALGARVTLISGVTDLDDGPPWGADLISVETAQEMYERVLELWGDFDCVVKAAAVADWRPAERLTGKWKKAGRGDSCSLDLVRNEDILETLGRQRGKDKILVGFAAETAQEGVDIIEVAKEKMAAKGCDLMIVNDVSEEGSGFGVETNRATVLHEGGTEEPLERMPKDRLAHEICKRIATKLCS